ncbi:lanthionine synthetase LanC family protein [uncultured Nocardioides sp.]|uniref:lanthionine synthetase LanC family protein n=1 Tax=uncultured Nocardioides sp. TaxID=198441 RepID=UPI00262D0057|nr:lanthionine synthetase LanC family protein [uncultured Nocardioides sp.]
MGDHPAAATALEALDWVVAQERPLADGVGWPGVPDDPALPPDLYSGAAGVVLALLEADAHDGDPRWAEAAAAGARGLAAVAPSVTDASLYFGATGLAVALDAVGRRLDDPVARAAARECLDRVRAAFDGERWGDAFDLMGGNAGIALGALALGDTDLALTAVEPYLRTAETTPYGVTWENRRGQPSRRHHVSHGTLGIAQGIAVTAAATGRDDLRELALAAVADVVARDESGGGGFLVPHSDPQQLPDRIDRFSHGWCHGPAGDAQVFRTLVALTGDASWSVLVDRCWTTVLGSGIPERRRPGFWDNNGRCCGTAGVLALALDREVEAGDGTAFAEVLVDDLLARATRDAEGVRWSNVEHRAERPVLPPRLGWAMGNAGIARELLRHGRLVTGRDPAYAVATPGHPGTVAA